MKVNATAAAASAARPLPAHLYVQVLAAIVLGVAMPSSTGVTGAGFMTPATTLFIVPTVPVAAIAPIRGIDRFMSEGRGLTNVIGNAVAAIVAARWQGKLDHEPLAVTLNNEGPVAHVAGTVPVTTAQGE
jgi:aerobic C4-dicarboxylate transport protein